MRLGDIDPQSDVALSLLRDAAADVRPLYGEVADPPWPTNLPLGSREVYVAAYVDDTAVACGAIRELDSRTCEIHRMYVLPRHRRKGVARAILTHLHSEARRFGYERIRLETGNRQPAAMKLYESYGFSKIKPFGKYTQDPTSVCYELSVEEEQRVVPGGRLGAVAVKRC